MAYKSITPQDMITAVEQYRYMPKMTEHISGITTNEVYDNVFSKDRKVEPTSKYFDRSSTKTIKVVTYSTDEGQFIPVVTKVIKAAEFEPQAIKIIKSYTPTVLDDLAKVESKTTAQIFKEDIGDFFLVREENIKNQCHEVFAAGAVTYPMRNQDGKITTADQIDYTTYFGAIKTLDTTSSTVNVVDWSDASITDSEIWRSILSIIKYGQTETDYKYFMNMKNIVIYASDAAFTLLAGASLVNANIPQLTEDGVDYIIGGKNGIRIINTNMPYLAWDYSTSTNKWGQTSANAMVTKHIKILDMTKGNFKIRDMKYLSIKSAGKNMSVPYEITTALLSHNRGMELAFATKPLVMVNPLAWIDVKVDT